MTITKLKNKNGHKGQNKATNTSSQTAKNNPHKNNKSNNKRSNKPSKKPTNLCFVCKDPKNVVKYKCPKCFSPYCSLACFKSHKGTPQCVAVNVPSRSSLGSSFPPPNPAVSASMLSHALSRRQVSDSVSVGDDDGSALHSLTRENMDRLDGSAWLKGELADAGLRHLLLAIETAPDRGKALHAALNGEKYGPRLKGFVDRMLVEAGVLEDEGGGRFVLGGGGGEVLDKERELLRRLTGGGGGVDGNKGEGGGEGEDTIEGGDKGKDDNADDEDDEDDDEDEDEDEDEDDASSGANAPAENNTNASTC
ncbi:hypothetical protein TrCOL_g1838 [Triparma columacea]|uniref:HIT-type domain-containing protein n=1 Tax=Triparma columacea TaxID=722753 RepID=A0A9W7G489_9STRA|nr:hypothetical protein TrCOL_g1838 [Triparma columacea]